MFGLFNPVWPVVLSPISSRLLDTHEIENVRNRGAYGVKREKNIVKKKPQEKRIYGVNNSLLSYCQGWSSTTCGLQALGLQYAGNGEEREREAKWAGPGPGYVVSADGTSS